MLTRWAPAPFLATGMVLIALLALADVIGNASPYLYLITLFLVWPFLLADSQDRAAMNRWESYAYLSGFLALFVAFVFAAGGWGRFENIGNFLPLLFFIPAIGLFNRTARQGNSAIIATLALVGAVGAAGMAAYEVYVLGRGRAVGFVNTTNPFATMAIMLGFLALMGIWAQKGWRLHIYWIGPIAGLYAAILAGTRSVLVLALALAIIVLIFIAARLSARNRIVLLAATGAFAVIAVIAALALGDSVRAFRAFESIFLFLTEGQAIDRSVAIRLELYRGGILAFLDQPIFGHGWRHHVEAARPYMLDTSIAAHVEGWPHLHNDYINFAAMAGIFGLFTYFTYLSVPVISTWRSVRDSQFHERLYGGFVVTTSYAVYGLFGSAFAAEMLLCFGPVMTAVLLGFCKDHPELTSG